VFENKVLREIPVPMTGGWIQLNRPNDEFQKFVCYYCDEVIYVGHVARKEAIRSTHVCGDNGLS